MRVIVTRPEAQALPFVARLREQGVDAQALPLLAIEAPADTAAVQQAWRGLRQVALAMFVSANAVQRFWVLRPAGLGWPKALRAGSTGPGTTAALVEAGVALDAIDQPPAGGPFDTEALWQQLRKRDWSGLRVLVVRGEDGRDWLSQQLAAAGAELCFVAAYRRVAPVWTTAQQRQVEQALALPQTTVWHFSSSEAIGHLVRACPAADWRRSRAWATHERIADAARAAGFGQVQQVPVGADALVAWLRGPEPGAPIESRPL